MVAVVGTSASSRAKLDRQLAALGTNLLSVAPGQTLFGEKATLPGQSAAIIGRIGPVESVTAIGRLPDAKVHCTEKIPARQSGGIRRYPVPPDLRGTVGGTVASGAWLNAAAARYPAVVLGATTAGHLGITAANANMQIWLGGRWFTVVGILHPVPLAPEL